jgi:hypothetical protein
MFDPINPAPPVTTIKSSPEDFATAGMILSLKDEIRAVERKSQGEPELTEPFTTIPVITGPVIVFNSVKNFCSSLSLAFAT